MINEYLDYIQEGYLFSDKTLSVRLKDFESGKNKKLLVFGPCGSGKSTLGEKLSKKYNVPLLSIDQMFWSKKYQFKDEVDLPKKKRKKQTTAIRNALIKMLSNNKRIVIEGVNWIDIYRDHKNNRPLILKQSLIILGLSSWRAGIRAGKRNMRHGEKWTELYNMTKTNYQYLEKWLGIIRKDVKNIAEEYKND